MPELESKQLNQYILKYSNYNISILNKHLIKYKIPGMKLKNN